MIRLGASPTLISETGCIAFQSNILALNAAVEARRSAEAAQEIRCSMGASLERVERDSALVNDAGATMTEVVSSIKRVTDTMGQIRPSSKMQRWWNKWQRGGRCVEVTGPGAVRTAAVLQETQSATSACCPTSRPSPRSTQDRPLKLKLKLER